MTQGEPPADEDDPQDVADHRGRTGVRTSDDGAAERPQGVVGHSEGGQTPRDGHDEQAGDDAGHEIGDPEPQAGEDDPDDVEQGTHVVFELLSYGPELRAAQPLPQPQSPHPPQPPPPFSAAWACDASFIFCRTASMSRALT